MALLFIEALAGSKVNGELSKFPGDNQHRRSSPFASVPGFKSIPNLDSTRVVWWNLDEELWRTPALTAKTRIRTTMDVYGFEFAFRLDIMAATVRHQTDPGQELLVVPVRKGECDGCGWRDYCNELKIHYRIGATRDNRQSLEGDLSFPSRIMSPRTKDLAA